MAADTFMVRSSKGVELAVHDLGGDGEPLFVCHATGFHGRCYGPFARLLHERFHAYALDFRGHGASTVPDDGDFNWEGMRDDLLAVLDHLGLDRVKAFGHSMGGGAILLASEARSTSIAKAYVFEPIAIPDGMIVAERNNPLSDSALRRRPTFPTRGDALMRYASRQPFNVFRADALAAYVEHGFVDNADGTVHLACAPSSEAATFGAGGKMAISRMSAVPAQVTVGVGVADGEADGGFSPAGFAPLIAEAIPAGSLIRYERMGHFGPLEDPQRVAADVLSVL